MPLGAVNRALRGVKLGALGSAADLPFNLKTLAQAGVIGPKHPRELAAIAGAMRGWGPTPAGGITSAARSRPDVVGVIDDAGEATFGELHLASNALARALRSEGVGEGDSVAVMCRNHRGFAEAIFACAKLGATTLLMNTDFARPQLAGVLEREKPKVLIHDAEFTELLVGAHEGLTRVVAWVDEGQTVDALTVRELAESHSNADLEPPSSPGRFVVLTSGTTGLPKGAQRGSPTSLGPVAILLSKMPLRSGRSIHVAAPMFHSWGFLHFSLGLALGSTFVLRRRFTPEGMLAAVAEHRTDALAAVPVMLQRVMELPEETRAAHDLSGLRVTAVSGSALPGDLATRWMDAFGDNLYNLYGSTEVAWATIATPEDMRAAPGTAGRVPHGTVVKILDEAGGDVPQGQTGRIFVGSEMTFEGYTGGGDKEHIEGLLSSGDVGHFDSGERLFVDGRDDEMIVSGGENVFPAEVEDLIASHPDVVEAAAVGVDDETFGQVLWAFVVLREQGALDERDVREFVKSNLASFKAPRQVKFMAELPRNATGKILKRALS